MEIDKEKVDEMTLALLYLTTFKDRHGLRAWKSHDWDVLNRLHADLEEQRLIVKLRTSDRQLGCRKLPYFCLQFSHYATSFFSTGAGT